MLDDGEGLGGEGEGVHDRLGHQHPEARGQAVEQGGGGLPRGREEVGEGGEARGGGKRLEA